VPHQGLLVRGDAVAKLEEGDVPVLGLPHEQVEIVVVEPAPAGAGLVGHPLDFT
jgi:hypothetical protein